MSVLIGIVGALILLFGFVVFRGAPYVPTLKPQIADAFDSLYPLTKDDVLLDIGSGDGRILREVSRRGARAIGIELNPFLGLLSRILSWQDKNVRVMIGDSWRMTIPKEVTVIYIFSTSRDIDRQFDWIEKNAVSRHGTLYVISFAFASKKYSPIRSSDSYFLYQLGTLQR